MKDHSSLLCLARFIRLLLCFGIFLLAAPVDAATSKDKRKLRAAKKTLRIVRQNLTNTERELAITKGELATTEGQLAAALEPAPFMEFVPVGDPGNANDPGNLANPNAYGAVTTPYKIGKYEVTNDQYVAFLNAIAETDTFGVFDTNMENNGWGGVVRLGGSGSYRYAVKPGLGNKPVTYMKFHNACRFCNWLHNDRPTGPQGASTTELGAYDLTAPVVLANNNVVRSPGAKFFIPTEDEWYKAAFFQPNNAGGDTDNYWKYATRSNDVPTEATVDAIGDINNETTNIANYNNAAVWNTQPGHVTTVGSGGPGSASHYGACDMSGNVVEITEGKMGTMSESRVARGGGWAYGFLGIDHITRTAADPNNTNIDHGFRVACPAD